MRRGAQQRRDVLRRKLERLCPRLNPREPERALNDRGQAVEFGEELPLIAFAPLAIIDATLEGLR